MGRHGKSGTPSVGANLLMAQWIFQVATYDMQQLKEQIWSRKMVYVTSGCL